MNRTHVWIAGAAVALAVAGWPGPADAVDPQELAPPGVCAGEERELRKEPIQSEGAAGDGATTRGLVRVHVLPTDVAAAPPSIGGPPPVPPSFSGPGPCDQPGSGCQGTVLPAPRPTFSDSPPTDGCDFPGCGEGSPR